MLRILRRSFVLFLLLCFIVPAISWCMAAPAEKQEDIKIIRYQVDDFFIPQISGMADYKLQGKINRELRGRISEFNRPEHYCSLWGDFEVTFYNRNLLGVQFKGYSHSEREAHPYKIDFGIHIDLMTGTIYGLDDLFLPGTEYESRIRELCRTNQAAYRLVIPGLWNDWTNDHFARNWRKSWPDGSFVLSASSVRLYTIPAFATGSISGYGVPYSDIMDIINTDGQLWKALHRYQPMSIDVELEKMDIDDFIIREYGITPGDNASWLSIKRLGEPKNKRQVRDGVSYDYGDIEMIVNTKDKVATIITDNRKISTRRGVHPGDSINNVKKRYGENALVSSFGEYDLYEYPCELGSKYILRFAVKQGTDTVSYISWRILEP